MCYDMNIKFLLEIGSNVSMFALLYCASFSWCSAVQGNEITENLTEENRTQRYVN